MSHRTRRHLDLLALAAPLRRYAGVRQGRAAAEVDVNASSFLVHQALAAAFAEPGCSRSSAELEVSLRADVDRRLEATEARSAPIGQ